MEHNETELNDKKEKFLKEQEEVNKQSTKEKPDIQKVMPVEVLDL